MLKKYFDKILKTGSCERKDSSMLYLGGDIKANFTASAEEYANNVVVYRCVNIIAQAASHIPWVIYSRDKNLQKVKLTDPEIYGLLNKPNNVQGGAEFFSDLVAQKLLYGNAYVLISQNGKNKELLLLHPNKVTIETENAIPKFYKFKNNAKEYKFPINSNNLKSQILHIKNYNPSSSIYGLSSLKAASKAIEHHNNTSEWNNNLLKNGARPTGALIMKDSEAFLSDEQFERLQEQLYEKFTGSKNSGKPLLLEGGLDWKDMSINPKDMDYIESKNAASREIALAFGVPPQLLGINGDNTYSNMVEARLALWEETIIPLLDKLSDSFSNWFSQILGREIIIDFDRDGISAISAKRYSNIEKIEKASFMTINEKRAIIGLSAIEGGDEL